MKRLLLLGASAFALAGCATGTPQQIAEKSLIEAHVAYEALGTTLTAAATTGALHGSAATQAKAFYAQVGADLAQADKDWDAGNAALVASDLANAGTDSAKITPLIPK
jgi:hypothetical protein